MSLSQISSRVFQPARTRLALTYLAIIMILSLGFSSVIYVQSTNEAKANLQRQTSQLQEYLYFTTPQGVQRIQDTQLRAFKRNLIRQLLALNLGMLIIGALVSYILALRSLRPLEETMAAQSRFTSDAAHELRTPLTVMKAEIEVALRDKKLTKADAIETLKSTIEEVDKLDALTSALLRLADSSDKQDRSYWQDYALADILAGAKDRVSSLAGNRSITIKLPKTKAVVHGDPDQLVELFVILLDNAIKYSPDGSTVSVEAKITSSSAYVKVIDKGAGIADVDLPHIFDRFYRAEQSRNKSQKSGYGLGLSLAQSIVHSHQGKIGVKSKLGKGSIFCVELPKA